MKVNVCLDNEAKMPTRAHDLDAGYDLYAVNSGLIYADSSLTFDTGVHMQIPAGYVGFVKAKSGLNVNHGLTCTGVVDAGYTGSIKVKLYNHGNVAYFVNPGDKIAQLVLLPIYTPELELVDKLEETERGANGFGSSGR